LMVDAPESLAQAPPHGAPLMFLSVDGGRSRISSSGTSQGPAINIFFNLSDGRCRTQGLAIDVFFNLGGGRCRTRQQHP
jgi:hypothetical protein